MNSGVFKGLGHELAARKLIALRDINFHASGKAVENQTADAQHRITLAHLLAAPVESFASFVLRRGNNQKVMPATARTQIAADYAARTRFHNVMIARVEADMIEARAGEPSDNTVDAARMIKQENIAGLWCFHQFFVASHCIPACRCAVPAFAVSARRIVRLAHAKIRASQSSKRIKLNRFPNSRQNFKLN